MSKSESITRSWQCDRIGCPTPPEVAEVNPYYHIEFTKGSMPQHESLVIDLCDVCILLIPAPLVVAWLATFPPTEEP